MVVNLCHMCKKIAFIIQKGIETTMKDTFLILTEISQKSRKKFLKLRYYSKVSLRCPSRVIIEVPFFLVTSNLQYYIFS